MRSCAKKSASAAGAGFWLGLFMARLIPSVLFSAPDRSHIREYNHQSRGIHSLHGRLVSTAELLGKLAIGAFDCGLTSGAR
jgi:hypothetical protein